ncbi:hypothetical protein DEA98_10725 [Brucella pseudogrignonensis]|nr:hypothetical protein [Brucella pseudogrignonensis]
MKERFEGQNRAALISSLKRQFDSGDTDVAESIASGGELIEFKAGDALIDEGAEDNDVFFLVSGQVSVVVKGQEVRQLKSGDHVGEMAAIEPSQRRAASVIAAETVVAVKMTGAAFMKLADRFPPLIWRSVAQELSRRLYDRNRHMVAPNEKPRMFIMSSVEGVGCGPRNPGGLATRRYGDSLAEWRVLGRWIPLRVFGNGGRRKRFRGRSRTLRRHRRNRSWRSQTHNP